MELLLIRAIDWFADILILALCVRAILSWFARDRYSTLGKVYGVLEQLTEPFVAPFRRLLANVNTGMFDFSVLIAFFAIRFIASLIIMLIRFIF
ncbi:MAG: YggT family protein [Mogibacterium sp.]|nr:YggT family protein [Mogibacterium sp.]